jgi:hypothetical protein
MGADPSLVFPGGRDAKEGVLKGPFHVREPSKNDTQPLQRRRHCLASQLLLGEVVWFGLVWFGLVELAWKVLAGAFSTTDTSLCVFGFCHGLRITKSRVFTTKCDGLQTAGKQWPFLSHRGTGQDKASACAGRTRPGLMTFQMSNMTKTRTHQSMHAMHNVHAT